MAVEKWSTDDFIESLEPRNWFSVKMVFLATLGMFSTGVTLFINSQVASALQCQWRLTSFDLTCITIAFLLGEGVGGWFWGRMSDIYGRKRILIFSTFMAMYFTLLSSASQSFIYYTIYRFLIGTVYNSVMTLTIVYNTEYTRSSDHGLAVLWYNIVFLAGNLFGIAVSFVTLNKYGWRVYIIYTTVPCIVLSIPKFLLKESIRYLQVKGKTKDIIKILNTITRAVKKSWPENVQLKTEVSSIYGRNISNSPVISKHWKSLLGLSVYGVPLYITYYGLPFLINFKLQHKNSCQIPQTLTLCTPLTDGEIMQSFFVNLGLLPGSILGYLLAEKVGRKTLLGLTTQIFELKFGCFGAMKLWRPRGVSLLLMRFIHLIFHSQQPKAIGSIN